MDSFYKHVCKPVFNSSANMVHGIFHASDLNYDLEPEEKGSFN